MKKNIPAINNIPDSTKCILESISDGVFTVDRDWKITFFNRAAEKITGVPRDEAVGRTCSDVFKASICESNCALRYTMKEGEPIVDRRAYIITAKGRRKPISISTALLKDSEGRITGGVETFRDLDMVEQLKKELEGRQNLGDMVSRSPVMLDIFKIIPKVAESESTVLIQGETGTGKELLARAIHQLSPRAKKPFIAVNCGALPDTLLESELFGYEEGAFTGARKSKPGRFKLADTGTIFLDEIGDISTALQVRLLRVLQEHTFEPLGATGTLKVDVRVITATNRNLDEMVKTGSFRRDLYYRINIMKIEIPPLRKRKEDIPVLVENFIEKYNILKGRNVPGITNDALNTLMAHNFPGNIRELENIIEHAFIMCGDESIDIKHLPEEVKGYSHKYFQTGKGAGKINDISMEAEKIAILDALERNNFVRKAAAEDLGIHKTTLYRKMKKYGISPKKSS